MNLKRAMIQIMISMDVIETMRLRPYMVRPELSDDAYMCYIEQGGSLSRMEYITVIYALDQIHTEKVKLAARHREEACNYLLEKMPCSTSIN